MDVNEELARELSSDHGTARRVGELIRLGADPNFRDEDGATPLHLAALLDPNPEDVKENRMRALLDAGADVDVRARSMRGSGWVPLHAACDEGSVFAVALLLQYGSDPNVRTAYGLTPLMLAAECGLQSPAKIALLFRAGADPELQASGGETALDIARAGQSSHESWMEGRRRRSRSGRDLGEVPMGDDAAGRLRECLAQAVLMLEAALLRSSDAS